MTQKPAIIAKGKYGLIISPPPIIESVPERKKFCTRYVLKYARQELLSREYRILQILSKSDTTGDLFVYPEQDTYREGLVGTFDSEMIELDPDHIQYASMVLPHRGRTYNTDEDITIEAFWRRLYKFVNILAILKRCGIIHYDIRDQNVLIDERGDIRLIDFNSCHYQNHTDGIIGNIKEHMSRGYFFAHNAIFVTIFLKDNTSDMKMKDNKEKVESEDNKEREEISVPIKKVAPSLEEYYETYEYLLKFFNKEYKRGDPNDYILKLYNMEEKDRKEILTKNLFKIDLYSAMHLMNDHLVHLRKSWKSLTLSQTMLLNRTVDIINRCLYVDPDKMANVEDIERLIKD